MKTEFKAKQEKRGIDLVKNREWETQSPCIKELHKEGAKKFFEGIGNLREAFRPRPDIAVCMDEGTAMKKKEKGVFTWADTGRLFDKDKEKACEKAARVAIDLGLEEITSHEDCGVAKLAWKWDNPDEKREPTDKEVNDYAEDWTKKLAEKIKSISEEMGKEVGKEVKISYITAKEMLRPKDIHNAVGVYYDGTGKFNPGRLENIPQGFVISRGGLEESLGEETKDYCGQELGIACSIAFGDHGFSKKFSKKEPFTIMVIGKNLQHLEVLKREAEGFLKIHPDFKTGKIKIDGFLAPEGL